MARRWTRQEEDKLRKELLELYVRRNMTIREIGKELLLAESSVFKRLQRLGIPSHPEKKEGYLCRIKTVLVPTRRDEKLAEFMGIMLGDGHLSRFQTIVTLGSKEFPYVEYVAHLMQDLFQTPATVGMRKDGYRDVYIGSVVLTRWLRSQGLTSNKVAHQVSVPPWIFERREFMHGFLRGFFDTDGSYYLLRFGRQISFTNHSLPLLHSLRKMLIALDYRVSEISAFRVYLTRKRDVDRFFSEIRPANIKHLRRYQDLTRR